MNPLAPLVPSDDVDTHRPSDTRRRARENVDRVVDVDRTRESTRTNLFIHVAREETRSTLDARGPSRARPDGRRMPLTGARETRARSAFTATAFRSVGQQTSSASTSTEMTAGSNGGGRTRRSNAGVRASATQTTRTPATRATGTRGGRGASASAGGKEESYVGSAMRGLSHVPHGNTALSVKADEERLSTITDEKERKRLKRLLRNRVSAQQARERKRLKRLLRNRVSAQQARERKKAYLASLEHTEVEKERQMHDLENRVAILERENQMLRQVIQTVTRKAVPPNAADFNP